MLLTHKHVYIELLLTHSCSCNNLESVILTNFPELVFKWLLSIVRHAVNNSLLLVLLKGSNPKLN